MRPSFLRCSLAAWLLAAILSFTAGAAWAYPPASLKRVEPILLPDGQRGTMRIVVGDGFLSDPVRIVILDAQNRLIARGPRTNWLSLVCEAPLRCHGYDHGSGEVIAPDPATFGKDGPIVRPVDDRDDLAEVDDDATAWGVTVRPATWGQWLSAESGLLARTPPMMLGLFAAFGLVAGLCSIGVRRPRTVPPPDVPFWLAALLFRLCVFGLILHAVFVLISLGEAAPIAAFGPALSALLLVWGLWLAFRYRARARAVATRAAG